MIDTQLMKAFVDLEEAEDFDSVNKAFHVILRTAEEIAGARFRDIARALVNHSIGAVQDDRDRAAGLD